MAVYFCTSFREQDRYEDGRMRRRFPTRGDVANAAATSAVAPASARLLARVAAGGGPAVSRGPRFSQVLFSGL